MSAIESREYAEKAEKKKQKEEEAFLFSLTKTVNVIKQSVVEEGQKAENILCAYFKENGTCPNGDNCEFSHDLNIAFNVSNIFSSNLITKFLKNSKVLSTSILI